jgi:superfamily II DNA/RNA helicase
LAYLLPSFKTSFSGVTLIIVPTRELCRQVRDFLYRLRPRNSTVAIHGGISIEKQLRLISKNIEYIVATPGRLWDICQSDEGSVLVEKLSSNEARLIIDEADKLFEMRKFEELDNLLLFFYR